LHALLECNWFDCGRLSSREYSSKKQVYCAPDMVNLKKSELRAMAEGLVVRAGTPLAAVTHLKPVKNAP